MKRINLQALFPLLLLAALVYAFSGVMFGVAPAGKVLNPFTGVSRSGLDAALNSSQTLSNLKGLQAPVSVYFDERKVPHIFAAGVADMYFAQGYVTASLRLWQMDFLTYLGAGRMSEIFTDPYFFEYDRNQRRTGILEAARQTLKVVEAEPESLQALNAYTAGVNACIEKMDAGLMPPEYALLDYRPEAWTNLKTILILKNVAVNMTGYGEDLYMTKMLMALGRETFSRLFPDQVPFSSPVMYQPGQKDSTVFSAAIPDYLNYGFLSRTPELPAENFNPRLGSNSWAVSGKKTASGYPMLACDPHLNLTLPCIWLEMQLQSPGINVYGVTMPGAPAVIIGYNSNIAWGLTNGSDDVKDWYKLTIEPGGRRYKFSGRWLDFGSRVEQIRRKGRQPFYDTVYTTVHGPVVTTKSFPGREPDIQNCALKWEVNRPANEFLAFIKLNRARNYTDFKNALVTYACPIQNFTFACRDNTIAIHHQGSLPVKWPGQGRFLLDGSIAEHLPGKYITADSLPQLVNPQQQYVFSANQRPAGSNYRWYYNGYFAEVRANRIRQWLERDTPFNAALMQHMQTDNVNALAGYMLPRLLPLVRQERLPAGGREQLQALARWTCAYNAADTLAGLYDLWWKRMSELTWDELQRYPFYRRPPEDYVLAWLIAKQPSDTVFDRLQTPGREQAGDIVTAAFMDALKTWRTETEKNGAPWGGSNRLQLMHLTNLPPLSVTDLPSAGHPDVLNAASASWGPSWRMIVELGPTPRAWGIYPGGQSGHPGSPHYADFVNDWNQGRYYELRFFNSAGEAQQGGLNLWQLKP